MAPDRRTSLDEAIAATGIEQVYHRPIGELSKGFRQRVGLAAAILHRPDLLVLDEPTEGLDPNQRVEIRRLIGDLGRERTVILSTHVLPEVQFTCSRLLIINRGRIVADGPVDDLISRAKDGGRISVEAAAPDVADRLAALPGVTRGRALVRSKASRVRVTVSAGRHRRSSPADLRAGEARRGGRSTSCTRRREASRISSASSPPTRSRHEAHLDRRAPRAPGAVRPADRLRPAGRFPGDQRVPLLPPGLPRRRPRACGRCSTCCRWVFLFFVPAVTMRSLAEDIRGGQIEVVLAQPLSELELLLGKYLGSVLFLWIALALTLAIPLGLCRRAPTCPGARSSRSTSGPALLAAGLAGHRRLGLEPHPQPDHRLHRRRRGDVPADPGGTRPAAGGSASRLSAPLAARIGVLSHFESMGRGVIDLRDVIYFVSLAGVFLALAYGALLGRKLAPASGSRARLQLGVGDARRLAGRGESAGQLHRRPARPDAGERVHLVARDAGASSGNLDDLVTVKVFASQELPTEVALMKRDVDDLLRDLRSRRPRQGPDRRAGPDRATTRPDARPSPLGIQPVQFNVIGQAELQVKQGYLGLAIQHGGRDRDDPVRAAHRRSGVPAGLDHPAADPGQEAGRSASWQPTPRGHRPTFSRACRSSSAKSYDVRDVDLTDSTQPGPDVVALVLAGTPDTLPPGAAQAGCAGVPRPRRQRAGARPGHGGVAAGADRAAPPGGVERAAPAVRGADPDRHGLRSARQRGDPPARPTSGGCSRSIPSSSGRRAPGSSPVNQDLGAVVLTWASTIDTTGAAKGTVTPAPGLAAGPPARSPTVTTIAPTQDFPQADLKQPAARARRSTPADSRRGRKTRGRLVVVGSLDFATDRFVRTGAGEPVLRAQRGGLAGSGRGADRDPLQGPPPAPLMFESAPRREGVKYANLIGLPLLVAVLGLHPPHPAAAAHPGAVPAAGAGAGERGMSPAARPPRHGAGGTAAAVGRRLAGPPWIARAIGVRSIRARRHLAGLGGLDHHRARGRHGASGAAWIRPPGR